MYIISNEIGLNVAIYTNNNNSNEFKKLSKNNIFDNLP